MSQPHCTADELMDVAEGVRAAHSVPHLQTCADCQRQVDDLRRVLDEIATVPVREPPAAFWGELSDRVHAAVALEPPPRARRWFDGGVWPALLPQRWMWPAVATVAVLLLAVVLAPRAGVRPVVPGPEVTVPIGGDRSIAGGDAGSPIAAGGAPGTADGDVAGMPVAEEAAFLSFMGDLADGLELDSEAAGSHGLLPSGATTEAAVADLSGEERVELQRLLQDALSGAGV